MARETCLKCTYEYYKFEQIFFKIHNNKTNFVVLNIYCVVVLKLCS